MSKAADRFKHHFEMILKDTLRTEIAITWNTLIDESADPLADLKQLGKWAAELLETTVDLAADAGKAEQEEVMRFVREEFARGGFDV